MILVLARLDYNPVYIYISLTFLNSSIEARVFGSLDSTLSVAAGGVGGPCSVATICGDGWFVGNV
jgi:hypothetical protein